MHDVEPKKDYGSNLTYESLGDFGPIQFVAQKLPNGTITFLNIVVADHDPLKIEIKDTATHRLLLKIISILDRTPSDNELILYGSLSREEIIALLKLDETTAPVQQVYTNVNRLRTNLKKGLPLISELQDSNALYHRIMDQLTLSAETGSPAYNIVWNLTFLLEDLKRRMEGGQLEQQYDALGTEKKSTPFRPVTEYVNQLVVDLSPGQLRNFYANTRMLAGVGVYFSGRSLLMAERQFPLSGVDAQIFAVAWCQTLASDQVTTINFLSLIQSALARLQQDPSANQAVKTLMDRTDGNIVRLAIVRLVNRVHTYRKYWNSL